MSLLNTILNRNPIEDSKVDKLISLLEGNFNLVAKLSYDLENFTLRQEILPTYFYTIKEVCDILDISKRTLQTWRDDKLIVFSQITGKIYFKGSNIIDLMNKNKVV